MAPACPPPHHTGTLVRGEIDTHKYYVTIYIIYNIYYMHRRTNRYSSIYAQYMPYTKYATSLLTIILAMQTMNISYSTPYE